MTACATPVAEQSPWIAFRARPETPARVRLFCLHHAGGSALAYRDWGVLAGRGVDVCPVQTPGRGHRIGEDPCNNLGLLARRLADALAPLMTEPYILFGHSMGAALAYETAVVARRAGLPPPELLAVSARLPAHWPTQRMTSRLSDADFLQELRRLNGTPDELLDDAEMAALILRIARTDFEANDRHVAVGQRLDCPILALGGMNDELVSRSELEGWAELTASRFRLCILPGDHFYLRGAAPAIGDLILEEAGIP